MFSVFLLQEETVIAAAAMTAAVRINLFIVLLMLKFKNRTKIIKV